MANEAARALVEPRAERKSVGAGLMLGRAEAQDFESEDMMGWRREFGSLMVKGRRANARTEVIRGWIRTRSRM